jgi:hypothetical protein
MCSDNIRHLAHFLRHIISTYQYGTPSAYKNVPEWTFCGIEDMLLVSWTVRGSNLGGGEIFSTRPDRPWGPPSLLYNGYRFSFPGVKRPGRGVDHPPPSSTVVKERVELYLYSPSGPSWPVLGKTLPFTCFTYRWLEKILQFLDFPENPTTVFHTRTIFFPFLVFGSPIFVSLCTTEPRMRE